MQATNVQANQTLSQTYVTVVVVFVVVFVVVVVVVVVVTSVHILDQRQHEFTTTMINGAKQHNRAQPTLSTYVPCCHAPVLADCTIAGGSKPVIIHTSGIC